MRNLSFVIWVLGGMFVLDFSVLVHYIVHGKEPEITVFSLVVLALYFIIAFILFESKESSKSKP